MEYLLAILLFLAITLIIKWKFKLKIYNSNKQAIFATLLFLIIGVIADSFAVWRGYWAFYEPYVLGFYIWFLPLEEYLLFLVAPLFGITMYKLFQKVLK
jgi:lycopene cyclase domain-containing protein